MLLCATIRCSCILGFGHVEIACVLRLHTIPVVCHAATELLASKDRSSSPEAPLPGPLPS